MLATTTRGHLETTHQLSITELYSVKAWPTRIKRSRKSYQQSSLNRKKLKEMASITTKTTFMRKAPRMSKRRTKIMSTTVVA